MFGCGRAGSGGWMLQDERWVCLERKLECGELLRGIGERGRASSWGIFGQELQVNGGGESSRLRFALVLCITMCTFYATRQTQWRQPLRICSQHQTKSQVTRGIHFGVGRFDGEPYLSIPLLRSEIFFRGSLTDSCSQEPRS